MEGLPPELVYEILLRVPATTLVNVARHVCQSWCSIISDPTFVGAHYTRSISDEEGKTLLFQRNLLEYNEGYFIYTSIGGVEPIGQKVRLPKGMSLLNAQTLVCKGLVLHIYKEDDAVGSYICNPILNQRITLPPMRTLSDNCQDWTSGFGYDSISEEYKVVQIYRNFGEGPKITYVDRCRIKPSSDKNKKKKKKSDIYCWEEVASMDYGVSSGMGVFINGKIHWILCTHTFQVKILAFDLQTESMNFLCFTLRPEPGYLLHNVFLKDYNTEKLYIDVKYDNFRTIWVMMEYGIEKSLVEEYYESDISKMWVAYSYSGHWKKDLRLFKEYKDDRGFVIADRSRKNIVHSIDFRETNFTKGFLLTFVPSLLSLCNEEEERR